MNESRAHFVEDDLAAKAKVERMCIPLTLEELEEREAKKFLDSFFIDGN